MLKRCVTGWPVIENERTLEPLEERSKSMKFVIQKAKRLVPVFLHILKPSSLPYTHINACESLRL